MQSVGIFGDVWGWRRWCGLNDLGGGISAFNLDQSLSIFLWFLLVGVIDRAVLAVRLGALLPGITAVG